MVPAGALVVDMEQWKGTVVANDTVARRITLKGQAGDVHNFTVHKQVPNLNRVKVGDVVTVDFVESVGIELKPPSTGIKTGESLQTRMLAPRGKPVIADVAVMTVDVHVTAVNQATRQLTVKTSSGSTHTIRVDPSVTEFSKVKVGDEIIVRATEAVVMTITK